MSDDRVDDGNIIKEVFQTIFLISCEFPVFSFWIRVKNKNKRF